MKTKWLLMTAMVLALSVAIGGRSTQAEPPMPAPPPPANAVTWDQPANIREAAERIAKIQRSKGAQAAIEHIDACYRTHSLATNYSAPFEGCIAQDYLQTKMLAQIYSRLPPEQLQRLKAPSPQSMAQAMGRRVVLAFSQYKVSVAAADAFKALVDTHGLPVFLAIVFPEVAKEVEKQRSKPEQREKEKN